MRLKLTLFTVFLNLILSLPSVAAEKIYLLYGPFNFSLPVESLEKFSNSGEIDKKLSFYLKFFSEQEQLQFRKLLNTRFEIRPFKLYKLGHTYAGKSLIQLLGEGIQIPGGRNGYYAIRGSLVQSALSTEGLTVMNVIRNFPTDIQIDIAYLLNMIKEIDSLNETTKEFMNQVHNYQVEANYSLNFDPRQNDTDTISKQTITFKDSSRNRELKTVIYLPENQEKKIPVIVISNGLGAQIDRFEHLAEHLSSHGFAVIIPDHPQSNYQRQQDFYLGFYNEPFTATEFIDRPLDISFILDQLQVINKDKFANRLKLDKVGIFGYSFGASTAFSLAGAKINFDQLQQDCQSPNGFYNISILYQCRALELSKADYDLRDERIQAIFAFFPFGRSLFGEKELNNIEIPVFLQTSDQDVVTPLMVEQISIFTWLNSSQKYMAIAENLAHSRALIQFVNQKNNQAISDEEIVNITREYINALNLFFFNSYLVKNEEYKSLLKHKKIGFIPHSSFNLYIIDNNFK